MTKIDLGQVVTILANVGVIVGIIFLAVELSQNNELLAAQARLAQNERLTDTFNDMIQSPEFAETMAKSGRGDELSPREAVQLRAFHSRQFRSWQWQFFERELGSLQSIPIDSWRNVVRGRTSFRESSGTELDGAWAAAWEANRPVLESQFVEFMDTNVFSP